MKEFKFNTTIKCNGCISKVKPSLDGLDGVESWEVDILNPKKPLTVKANSATSEQVMQVVKGVGFEIVQI
ncbi:MAG: heavy-metal-associated domain-containing protein [Flavobacteriia bacterium]|nr:heavy-metal-associated domain-containing protein [Flavobacteriia bacterium]